MPLEDQIIVDHKERNNDGSGMQNFLDSAQSAIAGVVAKAAAEKVADNMFNRNHNNPNQGQQQQHEEGGLYPNLNEETRNPTVIDQAQSAFTDAFAKRAAENMVDSILPSNNKNFDGQRRDDQSGFDLGSIGSSLLESLGGQILHPSNNKNPQQPHQNKEESGFDLGSVGGDLLSSLAGQILHPNQQKQNDQQRYEPTKEQNQTGNESGFDLGKVGTELLGSLADQVLHPNKPNQHQQQQPPLQNENHNQSGFDLGKVGSELLGSLAEQVLHPHSDKKEQASFQQQAPVQQQNSGDIGSILGSLAENVLGGSSHGNHGGGPPPPPPQQHQGSHTFADTAGEMAASMFESFADSVLKPNQNRDDNQQSRHQQEQYSGNHPEGAYQDNYRGPQNPPPHQTQSGDIGSLLTGFLSEAVRPNPHHRQENHPKGHNEDEENSTADIGSLLVNSLASKMLQPHHQQ